jgi:threonyl-tRNA synthetase
MVRKVLYELGVPFEEVADEAAFYGPKIDVEMKSAIGRWFTMATNQVDFSSAENFNLTFKNSNNEEERPLIIHRAPLGTHERYIGFFNRAFCRKFPYLVSSTAGKYCQFRINLWTYAHESMQATEGSRNSL